MLLYPYTLHLHTFYNKTRTSSLEKELLQHHCILKMMSSVHALIQNACLFYMDVLEDTVDDHCALAQVVSTRGEGMLIACLHSVVKLSPVTGSGFARASLLRSHLFSHGLYSFSRLTLKLSHWL